MNAVRAQKTTALANGKRRICAHVQLDSRRIPLTQRFRSEVLRHQRVCYFTNFLQLQSHHYPTMTFTSPPEAVFTAVIFQNSPPSDLEDPLLEKSTEVPVAKPIDNDATSPLENKSMLLRLKLLSFVTGCMIACASQLILSQTLWDSDILERPAQDVVVFSLLWSFWTCGAVFVFMLGLIYGVFKFLSIKKDDKLWDDCVFQMEAHLIVGALISISTAWIMLDVLQLRVPGHTTHNIVVFTFAIIGYLIFFRCMTLSSSTERASTDTITNSLPTYQLVASTLGLIVGICSQFLLSFVLWTDHMAKPIIDNVVVFSLLWSVCTVIITFSGCLTLRFLTSDEVNQVAAERIFLRMESHYVFCSLIGICAAWILMDVVLGMSEQIAPSIVMLTVSLAAFRVILYCFPEEKCLEEIEMKHVVQEA